MNDIRIGVLGAASITAGALLEPSTGLSGVAVTAVAARDRARAEVLAEEHDIPQVHDSYEDVLADPDIDAVYIPLPAALHAQWTLAAIRAGKHVLCEKPFTANSVQAAAVLAASRTSAVVVMEAHHSRYHPFQERIASVVRSGELGTILSATATFCVPVAAGPDIRRDLALGGGGLLDVGYYPVRLLRDLFGAAPDIVRAEAVQEDGIDHAMEADLVFDGGVRGTVVCAISPDTTLDSRLRIVGDRAVLEVISPFHPHWFGQLRVEDSSGAREEQADPRSSYAYQLEAFRDAVRSGASVPSGPDAALAQLRTIDAMYAAAGMDPRPGAGGA